MAALAPVQHKHVLDLRGKRVHQLQEALQHACDDGSAADATDLDASTNYLDDAWPLAQLSKLSLLQRLWLGTNNLTRIPDLSVFPRLQELYVNNNRISDLAGLAVVADHLRVLDLRANALVSLASMPRTWPVLTSLSLSCNALPCLDDLPPSMPSLTTLGVFGNRIEQFDLVLLAERAPAVRVLYLAGNPGSQHLTRSRVRAQLPALQWLDWDKLNVVHDVDINSAADSDVVSTQA